MDLESERADLAASATSTFAAKTSAEVPDADAVGGVARGGRCLG